MIIIYLLPLIILIFKASKWTAWITVPLSAMIFISQWLTYLLVVMPELMKPQLYVPWIEIGIFIGFIGLLIIMRPGLSIFDPKSLIPLVGAFFLGLYQIVTRKVSESDSTETSLFYSSIIGILLMSIISYFYWQPLIGISYILFIGVGLFFSLGLYFQIIALSKARASVVQPFHYTIIFWSIIWTYLFYTDMPDFLTIVGAIVISLSGIYVLRQISKSEHVE